MKALSLLLFVIVGLFAAPNRTQAGFPYRDYKVGTVLRYEMRGLNDGKIYKATTRHEVRKKDGVFYEEVTWEGLTFAGEATDLAALKGFIQPLSLDKSFDTAKNNFGKIPPQLMGKLAGPYFDLMTLYVDANPRLFGSRIADLASGESIPFPYGKPSSWADGFRILIGESCIDFRVTFQEVVPDRPILRVEHISPTKGICAGFPEKWMHAPIGDRPNNWVQIGISHAKAKKVPEYEVSYGLEYFDSHIFLDPSTGMIRSAELYNTVDRKNMTCKKAGTSVKDGKIVIEGLGDCSSPTSQHTYRDISLRLIEHRIPPGPVR